MKTLFFNNEKYEAEKIIKTKDSILGYIGNSLVFSFRGINDWSQFQIKEGQEWDIDEEAAEAAFLLDLDYRLSLLELGVS